MGNPVLFTDKQDTVYRTDYDALGRLTTTKDSGQAEGFFTYDLAGVFYDFLLGEYWAP